MSKERRGVRLRLSPARKFVMEILHHARKVPSLPVERTMDVGEAATLRAALADPPSWMAMFLRAYGLTAQRHPELRRALIPFPWPHLYEHPVSEAGIPIEREWEGENVVLAGRIRGPETMSLADITGHLKRFKTAPVWDIASFRTAIRLGRMPWLLRRWGFWRALNLSGYKRASRFGTFTMSSVGTLGAEQLHPLTPLTTYCTFGPIAPSGRVAVRIIYDHRVTDESVVARSLRTMEDVLRTTIADELRTRPDHAGNSMPMMRIGGLIG